MPTITQIIGPSRLTNLTSEQKRILMIVSNNNKHQYELNLYSTPEELDRMIQGYYEEKPIFDDLEKNGIKVNTLDNMLLKDFDEKLYIKAIPILLKWLKKDDLPNSTKAEIVKAIGSRPVSKEYAFDAIIDEFKKLDKDALRKKEGFYNWYVIVVGNVFTRWMDDNYADSLFKLLEDEKYKDNSFLIFALTKFKKQENREKAIKFSMNELNSPNHNNEAIANLIYVLQKYKAVQAKKLIESFLDFPKSYKRIISQTDRKEFQLVEDKHVRKAAQKAINSFTKLKLK